MTVYLGIDYGQKRIGLAISDAGGMIASPVKVLGATGSAAADAGLVVRFGEQAGADHLVVGLPINMNDTEGPQAKIARKFADELTKLGGKPVDLHDERLSSWAADQAFDEAKLSPAKRKSRRDAVAAQIMLQSYLDVRRQRQ